ncbi:MAG: hypothetical protein A2Y33_11490 [Spirochaetes bacterium GWF1_51_8]|nr:MAG: hypothetical protein A2Y33_11490 [Spirochaetes bacterium GWF1_51_8]
MKKGLGMIAILIALVSCAPAVPEIAHGVIIAGTVEISSGTLNAVYWDAGTINILDSGNSSVICSFRDGSDVYILGRNSQDQYGYWKNGAFTLISASGFSLRDIAVADGKVYITGKNASTSAGYWENGIYHALFFSTNSSDYFMNAYGIAVSGTNIAVVGSTNFLAGKGYWLNSVYHEVPGITSWYEPYFEGTNLRIICTTNGNEIGYLEADVYHRIIATNFYVYGVEKIGADLYICGYINTGGFTAPVYLKNGSLFSLSGTYTNGYTKKTILYNNEIYFAGSVIQDSLSSAAYWKSDGTVTVLDTRESYAESSSPE